MADYSRYNTETLRKMREKAFSNYYEEARKPVGNFRVKMRFTAYEKALYRLNAIEAELDKRRNAQKSA